MSVVAVVGNPRPRSRTHRAALQLRDAVADELGDVETGLIDLAELGFHAPEGARYLAAQADVLVVASPTYKATYTGLLKAFFDDYGNAPLTGVTALPLMVGAAPQHALAVDTHLTPLLLELGASCPWRGLYVLESELEAFATTAREWAAGSVGLPSR